MQICAAVLRSLQPECPFLQLHESSAPAGPLAAAFAFSQSHCASVAALVTDSVAEALLLPLTCPVVSVDSVNWDVAFHQKQPLHARTVFPGGGLRAYLAEPAPNAPAGASRRSWGAVGGSGAASSVCIAGGRQGGGTGGGGNVLVRGGGGFRFSNGCRNPPPNFLLRNPRHFLLPGSAANISLLQAGAGACVLHVGIRLCAGAYPNKLSCLSSFVSQRMILCAQSAQSELECHLEREWGVGRAPDAVSVADCCSAQGMEGGRLRGPRSGMRA